MSGGLTSPAHAQEKSKTDSMTTPKAEAPTKPEPMLSPFDQLKKLFGNDPTKEQTEAQEPEFLC